MAHELGHADDLSKGRGIYVDKAKYNQDDPIEIDKMKQVESHPINIENRIRQKFDLKLRTVEKYAHEK